MSSISPLISAEVWTVSADLTAGEIVTVTYINQTTFSIISENETADRALIWTESGEKEISFNETFEESLSATSLMLPTYISLQFSMTKPRYTNMRRYPFQGSW